MHAVLTAAVVTTGGIQNFGSNIAAWLQPQLITLWTIIAAVAAIVFLFERRFSAFFGWLVAALLVGVIIVNPGGVLQSVVTYLGQLL